jgi:alkylation response protein AidB-like acyl-CoA dehydrogenase
LTVTTSATTPALSRLSEDEQLFADSVYEFADKEIRPLVREMDEHAKLDKNLIPKLFDLGIMGIEIPEEYGGAGASFFYSVLAVEQLSRVDPSVGVFVDVQNTLFINALLKWSNEDLRKRYCPKVAKDTIGAYALSEAGSGSDAFAMATRAKEDGDSYVLTGRKLWITNGNEANLFIVFANVNPEAGYKGITAFLVERGTPGFQVGKKEDKLGIRASSTCELLFDGCRVPKANVMGEVGKGYKVAMDTLNEGRIGIGAQMIGAARAGLDAMISYTKERKQFGKAIADFQAVRHQIARAAIDLQTAKLLVYDAARLREYMKAMSAEPHVAGRPGSKVVADYALEKFKSFGLNASIEELEAYMPWPKERRLEMVAPTGRSMLIQEPPVPQDPDSLDADQTPTYNAYSADGEVTGEVVYVNYGMPADYLELDKAGVSVKGKIVLARYGGG